MVQSKIVGQTIAKKYLIESHLGGGGMAQVYLARSTDDNHQVAVKLMNTELLQKPSAISRFKREAQLQCKINHPNLVKGIAYGEENDVPYLIMEYVDGPMLSDLISKRGHLPPAEGIKIIYDVTMGLNYLFREEIVHAHRDIKPQNIMLTKGGTAKLTDFGIAKASDDLEAITMTSSFLGSPHYMSPEQIKNPRDIDIRSDIYSLGTVFYETLTGLKAYGGDSPTEILNAHFELDPPQISGGDDLVAACNEIFTKTMAVNPAERYQVPAELKAAIDPHLDVEVVVKDPRLSRSTVRFAVALTGILAAAAALVFALISFMPSYSTAGDAERTLPTTAEDAYEDDYLEDEFLFADDYSDDMFDSPQGDIRDALEGVSRPAGPDRTGGAVYGGGGASGADDNRQRGQEIVNINEGNNR